MARFVWHLKEFANIRKSEGMKAHLEQIGAVTVARCNEDLHAAQARRKQPIEDGYEHTVSEGATRARLFINPTTARAMAHEAVNHSILKNLPIGTPPSPPPDHEVPRELGRRGAEARNQGREDQ